MLSRVRLLLVTLVLVVPIALVPTGPVFGSDGNAARGSTWRRLSTSGTSSWQNVARDARPMRFHPGRISDGAAWESPQPRGVKPTYVRPAEASSRFRFNSSSTAQADRTWMAGPIDYSRFEITDPTQTPAVLHGKLFMNFTDFGGACSGTIVPSIDENLVLTAGHCLMDPETGETPTEVFFIPGYREEATPFGVWQASSFAVTDQWEQSVNAGEADPRFDIAALGIDPLNGTSLQDAFGSRGIMFNVDFRQQFDSFGYPANPAVHPEFDGEHLFTCESAQTDLQDTAFPGTPFTTGMGCDMTEGSSGGGWVINEEQDGGFLNSVVSYGIPGEPEVQYGPYFGVAAANFYETVSGMDVPDPEPGGDHERTLSLRLRRHLLAKGTLVATDGFTPCAAGAPIGLFKFSKRSETFKFLKETVTSGTGTWKIKVRDRTGYYAALAPEGGDELNFCLEAISKVVRHRH